ncbi:MAG: glycosyltransferase family protein [Bdellovibrionales bacterium]|nr:glycosyltransferase family protein [Bdellovibrionales bacterium]
MTTAVIIQARLGSSRFPRKVLATLEGMAMIDHVVLRAKQIAKVDHVLVATTTSKQDDELYAYCRDKQYDVFRGSEMDVLDRYCSATHLLKADTLIRITGDCPLIDPKICEECLDIFCVQEADYVGNFYPPSFPHGLDLEVIRAEALFLAEQACHDPYGREHVSPYITDHPHDFKIVYHSQAENWNHLRVTVDEPEDLELVSEIMKRKGIHASCADIVCLAQETPDLFALNHEARKRAESAAYTPPKD